MFVVEGHEHCISRLLRRADRHDLVGRVLGELAVGTAIDTGFFAKKDGGLVAELITQVPADSVGGKEGRVRRRKQGYNKKRSHPGGRSKCRVGSSLSVDNRTWSRSLGEARQGGGGTYSARTPATLSLSSWIWIVLT